MVTRRARSLFGLCLAIALLPLLSMAAGGREVRAQTAMSWGQLQTRSQTSAQPIRTAHAQSDAQHLLTPFLPSSAFSLAPSGQAPASAPFASHAFVVVDTAKLHPARAPPALS